MGKTQEHLSREWCYVGGREVDVGVARISKFLTSQAECSWSCEPLGSCQVMKQSMMRFSMLLECRLLLPYVPLMFTWPYSCDKCSQSFPIFCRSSASVYYTEHKSKNKNGGGLRTRLPHNHIMKTTQCINITLVLLPWLCYIDASNLGNSWETPKDLHAYWFPVSLAGHLSLISGLLRWYYLGEVTWCISNTLRVA